MKDEKGQNRERLSRFGFIRHPSAFILANPRTRCGWLLLLDDAANLIEGGRRKSLAIEGRRAGQQLVQQHAQAVDVAADVDIHALTSACSGLMYSGVPIIWVNRV